MTHEEDSYRISEFLLGYLEMLFSKYRTFWLDSGNDSSE